MIFFADYIPPELKRIVEFLNGQMAPADVLAVEVKQFVDIDGGAETKTLVPRVIGLTAAAETAKGGGREGSAWNEEAFMRKIGQDVGPEAAETALALLRWADQSRRDMVGEGPDYRFVVCRHP